MHEKKSSTLLRGCSQLADWHSQFKGCQCQQNKDQPANLCSPEPTGDPCSHHINTQCYQICHPNKQATFQHINGYNREDTSVYDNPVQYNTFSLQQHQLLSNCTTHQIHPGQSLGFTTLHVRNHHTHPELYWCSHYRNTLTTYTTCSGYEEDVEVHWGYTPFHYAPAHSPDNTLHFYRYLCIYILIADEQFLLLTDVPIQENAQQIEVFNLDIPHENYSLHYDIEDRYLVHNTWWNQCNWDFREPVPNM